MDTSNYRVYSIGIVATNKPLSAREVAVMPIETLPYLDGELDSRPEDQEASGVDGAGQAYSVKITADNAIIATWIGETHRRTPPDVRRGERVLLWQYGDADKFYWSSLGMDDNLRKLETLVFSVSDTADEAIDSTQPENSYWLEVSTHTGQITLHTSKANGEPFEYTFQFNTREGMVVLTDDVGNYLEFNSTDTLIRAMNRMGTYLELNKRDINFYAPNNVDGEAKNNVSVKAGKNISLTAGQNISAEAKSGNVDIKAAQNAVVDGGASAMLKSGGSFIKFTPAGGQIKAPKMEGGS